MGGIANRHAGPDGGSEAGVVGDGAGELHLPVEEEHAGIDQLRAGAKRDGFVMPIDEHATTDAGCLGREDLQQCEAGGQRDPVGVSDDDGLSRAAFRCRKDAVQSRATVDDHAIVLGRERKQSLERRSMRLCRQVQLFIACRFARDKGEGVTESDADLIDRNDGIPKGIDGANRPDTEEVMQRSVSFVTIN